MVTQCQNPLHKKPTRTSRLYPRKLPVPHTPVPAERYTSTMKRAKAAGMIARPPRNSAIPAAADPARPPKRYGPAAGMDRAVINDPPKNKKELHDPVRAIPDHPAFPELLEEFMQGHDGAGRWVTVLEFRTFFAIDEHASPAIAGFFRRLNQGPFFSCRYRVARIEKLMVNTPHTRIIKRYFITKRPEPRDKGTRPATTRSYPQ